jgi:hypothetical protein
MTTSLDTDRAEQLRIERAILLKADADIEKGWERLRNQQELLIALENAGNDTEQSARLVGLLQRTLVEWERHRILIQERIAYLEKEVHFPPR